MGKFRAVPTEDRGRYESILRYAFSPQNGPLGEEDGQTWQPSLFDPSGIYDGERLVSTAKLYYLDARVRGKFQRIGGLGAVATAPEDRKQGYVRDLCFGVLEEYKQNDVGLVALWPFSTAFYRNLGWGVANKISHHELSPDAVPSYDVTGRMVPLTVEDWERLRGPEKQAGVDLSLCRSEQWWHERTLTGWTGTPDPHLYGYERNGSLAGFLVYTVRDNEAKTLSVQTAVSTDEDSYRAILDFLGTHGAQIERIELPLAEGADLLDRTANPEEIDCEIRTGPMIRLTTVDALEKIAWPSVSLSCTIEVTDPLCSWNDDQFVLTVRDGVATVSRQSGEHPALTVDIGTLSQLAIGAIDIDTAVRLDKLSVEPELREPLTRLFEPRTVFLQEFF